MILSRNYRYTESSLVTGLIELLLLSFTSLPLLTHLRSILPILASSLLSLVDYAGSLVATDGEIKPSEPSTHPSYQIQTLTEDL